MAHNANSPGPWQFDGETIRDSGGDIIAELWQASFEEMTIPEEEHEANGALIAAAPDLLAACQYVNELTGTALTKEQAATLQKRVRSAIATATSN